jgi:hypothetical protein
MRGLCAVGLLLCFASVPTYALQSLTCMSSNNSFQRCDLDSADQRGVHVRTYQAGDCQANGAWGVDSTGIWVNNGCGAVFEYGDIGSGYAGTSSS